MMKRIILAILFTAFSLYSFAQDSLQVQDVRDTRKSLTISFCPTELLYHTHSASLDYRIKKWFALGVNIGKFKENDFWNSPLWEWMLVNTDEHPATLYNGTVVKLYAKFFLAKENNGFFLEPMFVYKDLYYNGSNSYYYGEQDYQYIVFKRSETAKQLGGNVIVGWKTNFFRKVCYFEVYWGLGGYKRFRDYTTDSWYKQMPGFREYDQAQIGHFTNTQDRFTMPFGFKLGFTIYGKK